MQKRSIIVHLDQHGKIIGSFHDSNSKVNIIVPYFKVSMYTKRFGTIYNKKSKILYDLNVIEAIPFS